MATAWQLVREHRLPAVSLALSAVHADGNVDVEAMPDE